MERRIEKFLRFLAQPALGLFCIAAGCSGVRQGAKLVPQDADVGLQIISISSIVFIGGLVTVHDFIHRHSRNL